MNFQDYKLSYQISPIILTGGTSADVPGGMTPIVSLTEPGAFNGLSGAGNDVRDLDNYFAHFEPIPGAGLIENSVGEYPFANQAVAANAIISQPLKVSLIMHCPVRHAGGYPAKLSIMTALQEAIKAHIQAGGTFTVATPTFIYTNTLLLSLRDVSSGESKQTQATWQWDFYKPLLTREDADEAQNALMRKLSGGALVKGDPPDWSGAPPTVGDPSTLAASATVPASSNLVGSNAAAPSPSGVTNVFGPQ